MNPLAAKVEIGALLSEHAGEPVEVTGAAESAVGISRQTWLLATTAGPFVLRCDLPAGGSACSCPLSREREIYRRLSSTDLPVASVLGHNDGPNGLGVPYYLRDYIPGDGLPAGWGADDVAIAASKEHARTLALVHGLSWEALDFDDLLERPAFPSAAATTAIDRIDRELRTTFDELGYVEPMLDMVADWLRSTAPLDNPRTALLKGSNGIGQEVWDGTRIVGLSDWELASLGDPASDWARCQGLIGATGEAWDEDALLDYYGTIAGDRPSAARVAFYRHLYQFEMLLVGARAAVPIARGDLYDARLAVLSLRTVDMGLVQLATAAGIL